MVWMIASALYPPPEYYSDDHQSTPWDSSWVSAGITVAEVTGPATYAIRGKLTDDGVGVAEVLVTASMEGEDDLTDTTPAAAPVDVAPHNMTSGTAPSPLVCTATTGDGYRCFDGTSTDWNTVDSAAGTVTLDYGSGNTHLLESYAVKGTSWSWPDNYGPKAWTLEGSNNNEDWDTLDTVTNQTGWTVSQVRNFDCDVATTAYRYFRLVITENNGADHTAVQELYFYTGAVSSGEYEITGAIDGTWTVTPDDTSYTWTPTSDEAVVDGADVEDVDFSVSEALTGNLACDTVASFEGHGHGLFVGNMACSTATGFASSGTKYNANDRGANLTDDTWADIDATTAQVGTDTAHNMGYFLRFPVTATVGQVVSEAILTLEAALSQSGSSALRITLLDYDDCGQFTDANFPAPSNVALSATYLAWNPAAWTADTRYEVDVATLVQAFIDRAGYVVGQHIGLLIAGGE